MVATSRDVLFVADCARATVQELKMADLPEDRLEPSPPFTNCVVDYFGPWIIKDGRKEVRRYGVIFTCLASRAVNLDTTRTVETDTFINVPRRFVCLTGPIRQLQCDQCSLSQSDRRGLGTLYQICP